MSDNDLTTRILKKAIEVTAQHHGGAWDEFTLEGVDPQKLYHELRQMKLRGWLTLSEATGDQGYRVAMVLEVTPEGHDEYKRRITPAPTTGEEIREHIKKGFAPNVSKWFYEVIKGVFIFVLGYLAKTYLG